jgi:protein-S-isoprenylcysteine O-methyltransferase Ste14
VFVGSLSYFLVRYATWFGHPAGGPVSIGAIAIDVLLFSAFALHHSVFARERVRAWVARSVPAGLERSYYVWIASVLFIGVCALWRPVAGIAWSVTGPAASALVSLQVAGLLLTFASAAVIDVLDLAGVRTAPRAQPVERDHAATVEFKTTGPYGWVRHPIYAGWFLIVFAVPTMTMTRLVFAVVSSVYVLIAIPFEERSLLRSAGDAYRRYMSRVRWKLVPGVY